MRLTPVSRQPRSRAPATIPISDDERLVERSPGRVLAPINVMTMRPLGVGHHSSSGTVMSSGRVLTAWRDRKPAGNCAFSYRCRPASYPSMPCYEPVKFTVPRLVFQMRGQIDGLARVLTAQFAKIPAAQVKRERRRLGEHSDEERGLAGKSQRIDVEEKYRQRTDQHINERQAFINRARQAHG